MLCTRQLAEINNSSLADVLQHQLEQLKQEGEELKHILEEREHQLATFKNSLATLNAVQGAI